jgi:hypothetical protein
MSVDKQEDEKNKKMAKDKKKKKDKKKDSKKKRKRHDDDDDDDDDVVDDNKPLSNTDSTMKERQQKRKQTKEELLALVPKVDPDTGIQFTKLQIRRMMKRVKRGLNPIPTPEEEQQRLQNEAELRKEDEAELAGMLYNKKTNNNNDDDEDDDNQDDDEEDADSEKEEDAQRDAEADDDLEENHTSEEQQPVAPPKKKSKRSKPVPEDYTCLACHNKHKPVHWIYDCPDKVTVRGANQKKKRDRGLHDPDSRKVFVSGLPFDVKPKDVSGIFQGASCGTIVSCKLVKFEDTGRCNGQAYVTFDSDASAKKALSLSGTIIDANALSSEPNNKKNNKSNKDTTPIKRRDLKLKVSKVLNRRKTKKAS